MKWRAEWSGGADEGRQPKNSAPPAPHEYADKCVYERPRATRALWWGAPQTADPPTPGPEKHQKSFRRVGESFLAGIRVAHKRLQEQKAPPPFGGYLKSEKSAVLTHFSDDFSLFESHKMLKITAFLRFNVFCGSHAKTQKML